MTTITEKWRREYVNSGAAPVPDIGVEDFIRLLSNVPLVSQHVPADD